MMYIRNASFIKASKDTSEKRVKSSNFSQFPHLNPFSSMDRHSFLCVLTDFFFSLSASNFIQTHLIWEF